MDTGDLSSVVIACGVAAGIAFTAGLLLTVGLRRLGRHANLDVEAIRPWRSPLVVLFVVVALRVVLAGAGYDEVADALDVVTMVLVGWILLVVARIFENAALRKFPETGLQDRRSRHERTKITLLHKVTNALIVTAVVIGILWTIPSVRQFGVGILASAGVVGIVFGLAAQTSLSNLFAGVQIAFTDAIRIDDIVDIEDRWGRIEEITLTYVVVRVWDGTSLILPCTYFTTTPFLNWTHEGTATTGTVEIGVDWNVSVRDVRQELARVLRASANWDGRDCGLHVDDASGEILKLVATVTAADGDTLASLRWEVREALVDYLQREHADVVPGGAEEVVARVLPGAPPAG